MPPQLHLARDSKYLANYATDQTCMLLILKAIKTDDIAKGHYVHEDDE